jgi:dihydroflavonol-4-reductase
MRALVTGANGHLGFNLTRALVERGYRVRASVRSLTDEDKTAAIKQIQNVEVVEANLDRPDQLRTAMEEIDVLFHVAAVFAYFPERGEDDMLRASIQGAENALRAAADARVRKVVLTSSAVTIPLTKPGEPPSTENDWNTDLRVPYVRAKTMGEKRAWEVAHDLHLDLVTVLPGAIAGPGFQRNTPSIDVLQGIMAGTMRWGAPKSNFPYVDVRDVVSAHILAAEKNVSGRFIACNDVFPTFRELTGVMHEIDPRTPRARFLLPDFMMLLGPTIDRLSHRYLGTPRVLTPELIACLRGRVWNCSNARLKQKMGWSQSIPLRQSLADTMILLRTRGAGNPCAPPLRV